jgi:biofilm PGA synthesis N-glycosyltransferase PgaC
MQNTDYILVTPARNESEYIYQTLKSVVAQTILPQKWVIVSDGSTDDTDRIVERYINKYKFIELVRRDSTDSRNFSSKVYAIREGLLHLDNAEYEFIGNLDADISFSADYFERILKRMNECPGVGIGGGHEWEKIRGKWIPQKTSFDWSVTGGVQFFRRKCFKVIGGYLPLKFGGEDSIAEVMARMHGWQVRTFPDIKVRHHRPMGTEGIDLLAAKFRGGILDHSLGTHFIFEVAKCLGRIFEPPKLFGAILRFYGFCWAALQRKTLAVPEQTAAYLRKEQLLRLRKFFI